MKIDNVIVIIPILKQMAGDVMAAFIHVLHTNERQKALNRLCQEQAAKNQTASSADAMNSNDPLFSKPGQQVVCLQSLAHDLESQGYHLAVAEASEKESDPSHIGFCLIWSKNSPARVELTPKQLRVFNKFAQKTYWKVFGHYHPKAVSLQGDQSPIQGSIVILIFSGIINETQMQANQNNILDIRMMGQGQIHCVPRTTPCAQAQCNYANLFRAPSTMADDLEKAFSSVDKA